MKKCKVLKPEPKPLKNGLLTGATELITLTIIPQTTVYYATINLSSPEACINTVCCKGSQTWCIQKGQFTKGVRAAKICLNSQTNQRN